MVFFNQNPSGSSDHNDDSVLCEESRHRVIQVLSYFVVIMFACGLPLAFGFILVRKASAYQRDTAGSNVALAKKVAEDLNVDEKQASFVIRDITIGEDYSFLMDAVRVHNSICPLPVVYRRSLTHYL